MLIRDDVVAAYLYLDCGYKPPEEESALVGSMTWGVSIIVENCDGDQNTIQGMHTVLSKIPHTHVYLKNSHPALNAGFSVRH